MRARNNTMEQDTTHTIKVHITCPSDDPSNTVMEIELPEVEDMNLGVSFKTLCEALVAVGEEILVKNQGDNPRLVATVTRIVSSVRKEVTSHESRK